MENTPMQYASRADVLNVARGLMAKKGFAAMTLEEIAQELGFEVPVIRDSFRSKDEIGAAIVDSCSVTLAEFEFALMSGSAKVALRRFVKFALDPGLDDGLSLIALISAEWFGAGIKTRRAVTRLTQQAMGSLTAILGAVDAAVDAADVASDAASDAAQKVAERRLHRLAVAVMSLLQGQVLLMRVGKFGMSGPELDTAIFALVRSAR